MSAEWSQRAEDKLNSLKCIEDGFCGGGTKPSEGTFVKAKSILDVLIRYDIKPRRIAPIADGGIVFAFSEKDDVGVDRIVIYNDDEPFVVKKEECRGLIHTAVEPIRIDCICDKCGMVWITKGEPSEEGTQMCLQRCFCGVDYRSLM